MDNINEIKKNIENSNLNIETKILFKPDENGINDIVNSIKNFGEIYSYNFKFSFRKCPLNIKEERKYEITGEKKNILTNIKGGHWTGALCENELDKSIEEHKWKIKILKSQYKNIMVGVAPIDFDFNSSSFNTCGWYYYCNTAYPYLYSGPPYNYYNKNIGLSKINDEVIIIMNMKKKTLKFIINNEDKGDSYTNLPIDKPIFPAVLLSDKNDSVEIIEC